MGKWNNDVSPCLGWVDIYERMPQPGNHIEIRISDEPHGNSGSLCGIMKVNNTPKSGEHWPLPDPRSQGRMVWIRYWRRVQ
jgi:hypothetical protein